MTCAHHCMVGGWEGTRGTMSLSLHHAYYCVIVTTRGEGRWTRGRQQQYNHAAITCIIAWQVGKRTPGHHVIVVISCTSLSWQEEEAGGWEGTEGTMLLLSYHMHPSLSQWGEEASGWEGATLTTYHCVIITTRGKGRWVRRYWGCCINDKLLYHDDIVSTISLSCCCCDKGRRQVGKRVQRIPHWQFHCERRQVDKRKVTVTHHHVTIMLYISLCARWVKECPVNNITRGGGRWARGKHVIIVLHASLHGRWVRGCCIDDTLLSPWGDKRGEQEESTPCWQQQAIVSHVLLPCHHDKRRR